MEKNKEYIGDAVYAEVDDLNRLILTTEDGYGVTNRIVLEPEVLAGLAIYLKKVVGRIL